MRTLLLFLTTLVFAACGPISLPAGAGCAASDECSEGLSCLDFSVHPAGQECSVAGKSCSVSCTTDADCAGLAEDKTFKCFKNCDETSSCGAVGG